MFCNGRHPSLLGSSNECGSKIGDLLWIIAERTDSNTGIMMGSNNINHGCQIDINTDSFQLACRGQSLLIGQIRGSCGTKCHVARKDRNILGEADNTAPFLINGN